MIFTSRIASVLHVFLNLHHSRPEPARLSTKKDVSHLSLQQVSQDSAQDLFNRVMPLPYQGGSRIELHVCCIWIPVVSQGVDCFYSVGLGCSGTFTVIIINDPCYVFIICLSGTWRVTFFTVLSTFCIHHSFSVTIFTPSAFAFFLIHLQLK
jgi:hypothetical protein